MNPKTPAGEKDFGRDMAAFEKLPAKTKELELLRDQAEKATGADNVALTKLIRDKAQPPAPAPTRPLTRPPKPTV